MTRGDVSWMDLILYTTVKVTKHWLRPFKHTKSISKQPPRPIHIGNIMYYLIYLRTPFPRGLKVDPKGTNTLPILMLSMHIDRLDLVNHLY